MNESVITDRLAQYFQFQSPQGQRFLIETMDTDIQRVSKWFSKLYKQDPIRAFKELVKLVDDRIRAIPSRERDDFSCRKGCSFCCRMNVDVHKEEAVIIRNHCRKRGIVIDKQYLSQQLEYPALEIGWSKRNACVFLKDGMCSIYHVRPIFCRKYFVVTPKEDCEMIPGVPFKRVASHFDYQTEIYNAAVITSGLMPGRLPEMLLSVL
jgi:Fe-S-cluster containining protein